VWEVYALLNALVVKFNTLGKWEYHSSAGELLAHLLKNKILNMKIFIPHNSNGRRRYKINKMLC